MVGGTASAVTVQTNSGVTVLFTYSADVGRWQNWCCFHDPSSLLHPGCVSLLLAGLHTLTHSHSPYPAFYGSCLPATLAEENIHVGSVCQLDHYCVGDVIQPFDAKDAPEAT